MKGAAFLYYQVNFLPDVNCEAYEFQTKVFVESRFANSWAQYNLAQIEVE